MCARAVYLWVYEVALETINIQEALVANSGGTTPSSAYDCNTQLYEIAMGGGIIGFAYTAHLVWRICNFWRISSASAGAMTIPAI